MQFNSTLLVTEQINNARKILNVYIVYDLDNWPKNPEILHCLFGATNVVKNSDNEKYVYSG